MESGSTGSWSNERAVCLSISSSIQLTTLTFIQALKSSSHLIHAVLGYCTVQAFFPRLNCILSIAISRTPLCCTPSYVIAVNFSPTSILIWLLCQCASASRWTNNESLTGPDGVRRDTFAEYHAGKTRQYIDRTMASGAEIFSVLQACIILSWYFYAEGRWVEVWIFAGFQTRVAVPLRLNHPGTFSSHGSGSPGAYLDPPKNDQDLEMRRRTWWMAIVFDRIASVGGWLHGIEYRHIATELPLRSEDFHRVSGPPILFF